MTKSRAIAVLSAALVAVAAWLALARAERAGAIAPKGPLNVVLVMSDDQEVGSLRPSLVDMQNVRTEIAERGVTFSSSFVNFPLCCPSRTTYLTGLYAHNSRVRGTGPPRGGFEKFQSLHGRSNLAVWLNRAGYFTGHVGKFLNGYGNRKNRRRVPPAWDEWHAYAGRAPNFPGRGGGSAAGAYYDYFLNDGGRVRRFGERAADYATDVFTRRSLRFIRRADRGKRDRAPFFLSVAYYAPHKDGPHLAGRRCAGGPEPARRHFGDLAGVRMPKPPSFDEAEVSDKPRLIRRLDRMGEGEHQRVQRRWRCRRESLLAVDEGVGRIVAALKRRGELERTLIVYTSDNGYFQGEHRIRSGKVKVYEEASRVPLVMRGPGVSSGVSVDELVINADLAPTILDAANVTTPGPGHFDGQSLLSVAGDPSRALDRDLLIVSNNYHAVRTRRYLWVEYLPGTPNSRERELYDLAADPWQLQSRHEDAAYAEVRAALAARLDQLRDCRGASCR
jgi:N-acetylglucosamine-6-sulfatase